MHLYAEEDFSEELEGLEHQTLQVDREPSFEGLASEVGVEKRKGRLLVIRLTGGDLAARSILGINKRQS